MKTDKSKKRYHKDPNSVLQSRDNKLKSLTL